MRGPWPVTGGVARNVQYPLFLMQQSPFYGIIMIKEEMTRKM